MQEAEGKVAELNKKLEESGKNEEELRDSLAHQQAVHEALQKETSIAQEVLHLYRCRFVYRDVSRSTSIIDAVLHR
jgi:hypothetical protein